MTLFPHGVARAALSHARLGYAGGSRRSSQSAEVGDPQGGGTFYCEFPARRHENGRNFARGKNADDDRHIPARRFDMFGERIVVVIDRMLMNDAAGMSMGDDVTVTLVMRVAEYKAEIIVAGIARCGFRRGNEHALDRKGNPRCHHDDSSQTLRKWSPGKAQQRGGPAWISLRW